MRSDRFPPAAGPFRPARLTAAQDWDALDGWLAAQGCRLDRSVAPRQFSSGLANLNYLVSIDGAPAVLRRPPPGPLAEGANDMAREWRVLSRLPRHYPLAPRGLLFCADSTVLGAPFQVIEYRAGLSIAGQLPSALAGRPEVAARLTAGLVTALADLHAVDPAVAGLDSLGRPDGFLGRQVEGWSRRAAAAYDGAPPLAVQEITDFLRGRRPPEASGPSLIHCDFKLDNMLLDPETLEPVAVVDWDMATRGDPLFDVAVLLSYWTDPDDPAELHNLGQVPSLEPGFPRRRELAARYFAAVGSPAADLAFHLTLARLRLAVVWQQLFGMYGRGALSDPKYATFAGTARAVLDWTADTLDDPPL